jgi:hypothetical protein
MDARIVGITDAFDAMTSTRPYRTGMPIAKALTIIEENLDTQFDAEWGRRFIALGARGELEHIVGHTEPGILLQECPACGPIVVVDRHQQDGALVYCRHCTGELRVSTKGPTLSLTPTGRYGDPAVLEPSVEQELLGELVSLAEACLADVSLDRTA